MKEEMQKKLFCKIVLVTFFVMDSTFNISNCQEALSLLLLPGVNIHYRYRVFHIKVNKSIWP